MERLWSDLRVAARGLLRSRRFLAAAVGVFVVAIAANGTIFTLAERLFFSQPPLVAEPQELVRVDRTTDHAGFGSEAYPDYLYFREHSTSFVGLMAYDSSPLPLKVVGDNGTDTIAGGFVSWNYFDVLGITPLAGRWFLPTEEVVDAALPVAVLSAQHAIRWFDSPAAAVGRSVSMNGRPFTIIGVVPFGFSGIDALESAPDVWLPIVTAAQLNPEFGELPLKRIPDNTWVWLDVVGRLKPRVTALSAQTEMSLLASQLEAEFPEWNAGWGAAVSEGVRLHPRMRQGLLSVTRVLAASVGLVFLIALINVAILLGARVASRQNELQVRLALGAAYRRLLRLLLIEAVLVGLLGAAGGFALAFALTRVVVRVFPYTFGAALVPSGRVLVFCVALSVVSSLVVGWLAARLALRTVGRSSLALRDRRRSSLGQSALVVGQVAIATVLVVAGTLLARSLQEVRSLDLGFEAEGLTFFGVSPQNHGYEAEEQDIFVARTLERLRAVSGFDEVSATKRIPFRGMWTGSIVAEGMPLTEEAAVDVSFNAVAPRYFRALGTPLLAGREFEATDTSSSPPVVIVNRAFVDKYWPGQNAIGKSVWRDLGKPVAVVGVVENATYYSLGEEPLPHAFVPMLQRPTGNLFFLVRSSLGENAVQRQAIAAVESIDPAVAVQDGTSLTSVVARQLGRYRTGATMIGLFAAVALLLASAGLYAVLSYRLLQRLREIGVRVACGAGPLVLATSQLVSGLRPVVVGLVLGTAVAVATTRFLSSLLFGIHPLDPLSFGAAVALLFFAAFVAAASPVRRALRVDPIVVLKGD